MEQTLAEIRMFAGNFAPRGWLFCQGQILPISQNQALFSLLGTTYGGDGRTTFALPDLQGRIPIHNGRGNGLTDRPRGQKLGTEENTLTIAQMANHNHTTSVAVNKTNSDESTPEDCHFGAAKIYAKEKGTNEFLGGVTSGNTGANTPVYNMAPYLAINYIIATTGTFPSRS